MSEILVEVTRNPLTESIHRGDIAVVNTQGELLYAVGDASKVTYTRSTAKPVQALNVFLSGAAERFFFSEAELAIMTGSHFAEDFHIKVIEGILYKIGLSPGDLKCGAQTSLRRERALELARMGTSLNAIYNDCSGKHVAMLASCVLKNYDLEDYLSFSHPLQREILKIISYVYQIDEKEINLGVDGCDAPVFGFSLYHMAWGYARFTNSEVMDEPYRRGAEQIYAAMQHHPEMVAGTEGFSTELIKRSGGRLIGKIGAEGVFCIGVKDKGLGIAFKMEDGSPRGIPPVAVRCLEELKILEPALLKTLEPFKTADNINSVARVVGKIRPVFHLKRV